GPHAREGGRTRARLGESRRAPQATARRGALMHDLEILVQILILGLANGALFALIALGYTLVYGIIELINFAHGEVYMIGTFTALTVVLELGVTRGSPPEMLALTLVLALVLAMVVCAA